MFDGHLALFRLLYRLDMAPASVTQPMSSLSVAASWEFAQHMADFERFMCAMCSQHGIAAFVTSVSRDNGVIVRVSQW